MFSIHFVDEDDNFVTASWGLRGKKLYRDIFYQHQPIPSLISAIIQKQTHPNSFFLLVKRHREFIYIFSAVSFIFLSIRFGWIGVAMAVIFELSKFSLLGNLFLAETFVVPLVIYISGFIWNMNKNRHFIKKWDIPLLTFSMTIIWLTLLPLIPFVIISSLMILNFLSKAEKKFFIKILVLWVLVFIVILSPIVDWKGYLRETVFINLTEYIPGETNIPISKLFSDIFLFPINLLIAKSGDFFLLGKLISLLYLGSSIFLFLKKRFILPLSSLFFIAMVNLRPLQFDLFYQGFHQLPVFFLLCWSAIYQMKEIEEIVKGKWKNLILIFFGLILFLFGMYGNKEFSRNADPQKDIYINFSPFFGPAETIRNLSTSTDTVLVAPSASLIYWQSGLLPSSPHFFTYDFMYSSKLISKEIKEDFTKNPPTFFYFEGDLRQDGIYADLTKKYIQIVNNEGKGTALYIRQDKLKSIPKDKWKFVNRYGFYLP